MAEPTRFTESNALLAVCSGDSARAREIVGGMLAGERRQLAIAATALASICTSDWPMPMPPPYPADDEDRP